MLHLCGVSAAMASALWVVRGVPASAPHVEAAAACGAIEEQGATIAWIEPEEALVLHGQAEVTFVDCRSEAEFVGGHVAGAVSVPAEVVDAGTHLAEVRALARTVVTYCGAEQECARSMRVANFFAAHGVRDVRVLRGGLTTWMERGYPAQSGGCPLCVASN